jgi:hypothetical protein
MDVSSRFIQSLVGKQLSSVEFVRDYVQLRFYGPTITAFVGLILLPQEVI